MKKAKNNHVVFAILFLVIALIGFGDATYLTVKHFQGGSIICGTSGGCDIVTTSEYAKILGVPVAPLGMVYYLSVIVLSVLYLDKRKKTSLKLLSKFTVVGLLASSYFVYLQLFVIGEICYYCMGSAASSTLLFLIGMVFLKKHGRQKWIV